MRKFAIQKLGSEKALTNVLPKIKIDAEYFYTLDDDYVLSEMAKIIFKSGLRWEAIDEKWVNFENVFNHFSVDYNRNLSTKNINELAKKPTIIRHLNKIESIQKNAQALHDIAKEFGSFGYFLAQWDSEDYLDLLEFLRTKFTRLTGISGQYFLRSLKKDGFIMTKDVSKELNLQKIIPNQNRNSLANLRLANTAIQKWHSDSGENMATISKILALQV